MTLYILGIKRHQTDRVSALSVCMFISQKGDNMVSTNIGLTPMTLDTRFNQLLSEIEYRNSRYPYGNVDTQISTIKANVNELANDPYRLNIYKENLLPHLEILSHRLKRLVA